MYLLTKVHPLPATADFRQQAIFFHNSQYCFRISFNIFILPPFPDPSVFVSLVCLFSDILLSSFYIVLRPLQTLRKVIVTTARYTEKLTHNSYRIFTSVTVDYRILYFWPRFLWIAGKPAIAYFPYGVLPIPYKYPASVAVRLCMDDL